MKNLDLKIPVKWNDLTPKQLLYVCELYLQNLTELKFKAFVFLNFTRVKALPKQIIADGIYYFFKKKRTRFSLTAEEFHWFLHSTDFLLSDSHLTKNLFPQIRILNKRFFGPSNSCYNISVHEFMFAEKMIDLFHASKDKKYLRMLCAILYRPQQKDYNPGAPDFNGDRREPFNDFTFERRARLFRFLSAKKQYAAYIFYIGCRNALIEKHPYLFNFASISSESSKTGENLKNLLVILNQGDITRNKEILKSQIWEAFSQLNELARQNKQNSKK